MDLCLCLLCQPTETVWGCGKVKPLNLNGGVGVILYAVVCHFTIGQEYTNILKFKELPQNSRCQKGGVKHDVYQGFTNIRHHCTKFSHFSGLVPRVLLSSCRGFYISSYGGAERNILIGLYSSWITATVSLLYYCSTVEHIYWSLLKQALPSVCVILVLQSCHWICFCRMGSTKCAEAIFTCAPMVGK